MMTSDGKTDKATLFGAGQGMVPMPTYLPVAVEGMTTPALAYPESGLPPALHQMPNVLSLLKALRRRWFLASLLGLVAAAAAGGAAWALLPPAKYRAEAMLRMAKEPPRMIFTTQEQPLDFETFKQDQRAYLKSQIVLNSALRDPEIAKLPLLQELKDPIEWLEKNLEIGFMGQMLTVGLAGKEPDDLALVVNAVTDAYLDEVVNADERERRQRYEELKTYLQTYQQRMQDKRRQIQALGEQIGTRDGGTAQYKHQESIATLAEAQRSLGMITSQLRFLQAERDIRRAESGGVPAAVNSTGTIPKALIDQYVQQDEEVQRLLQIRNDAQKQLAEMRRLARSPLGDPTAKHYFKMSEEADAALQSRVSLLRPQIESDLRGKGTVAAGMDPQLADLERSVKVYEELEKLAKQDVERLSQSTQGLGKDTWSLAELQDEIRGIDGVAAQLSGEVEKLNIELDVPPRVEKYQQASAPRKQTDKRIMMAGAASMGALGLMLAGIAFLEFRSRRVVSVDDVTLGLGLQLVGALPAWPRGRQPGSGKGKELVPLRNVLHESVDAMRTVLLRMAVNEQLQTVMVTSAVEGEGKTSLACHLASSLARAGRKTVLIDGDLRKPVLHRLFDMPRSPGLAELLLNGSDPDDALQQGPVDGLWVITAGESTPRAVEALALPAMHVLIETLRQRFDFVVIDTAPVLPVADTLLIGQHVDGTIFSILSDVSRIPKVYAAHERLKLVGIRNLGTVMTGVHNDVYASAYYYSTYTTATGE